MKIQATQKASKGYRGKKASAVYAHMGIWYDRKSRQIHLTIPKEKDFHTTVSKSPNSKRCHANLYSKLRKLLKKTWSLG